MNSVDLAKDIRKDVLRMTHLGKSSHIGSVFSIADILAVLYGDILAYDSKNPAWDARDRFILSKGHAGAGVYAALANVGFFSKHILDTHYQDGSNLSGHVSHKGVPGVELSTGSLGHGLSVGVGMAYNAYLKKESHRTFVLLGDGECNEGSVWEAALFAGQHALSNLVAIVDYNKIQGLGATDDIMTLGPFVEKWQSFGWAVHEADGHDHAALTALCKKVPFDSTKPSCIIAHTTKGKGVSFMEDDVLWHYRNAQGEEYEQALKELS